MRKLVLSLAAVVAMLSLGASTSGAVTAGNPGGLAGAIDEADAGLLQQVAHGCGAGWWRGPDGVGRCRPMRAAPPVVVVPGGPRWCHRPATSRNFRC